MKNEIKQEVTGVLVFVGIVWGVFLLDWILPWDLTQWGIWPRSLVGLIGIPFAPFLHGGWGHLLSNTVPLVVLLVLLVGSRARTWPAVAEIVLLSGGILWLIGRSQSGDSQSVHVGASMLIYGLITFLVVAGFRERRMVSLAVALIVGFLYGTTLVFGVLPTAGAHISWEGHLAGAIAGAIIAYLTVGGEEPSEGDQSHVLGTNESSIGP